MTDLGSYITNEYGLLTLIFSYLPSRDLLMAAKVCKEWRDVAFRILSGNNVPKSYIKRDSADWAEFDDKIHPKAILHFSLKSSTVEGLDKYIDLIDTLDKTYSIRGNAIYNIISNSWFIASETKDGKLAILNERDKNCESLLLLPEMRGVEIEVFSVETHYLNSANIIANINVDVVSRSKCFLLFANPVRNSLHLIHKFVTSFPNPQTLVMAGGIAFELFKIDINTPSGCSELSQLAEYSRIGILGISISGDNVTAHSDLHDLSSDIDVFLENFSKKVGPKPQGHERIAFMFVCVDRCNICDEEETFYFSKYFPSVPVYGFGSLGEYCIRNPMIDDNIEHKRKKVKSGKISSYKTVSNLKYSHEQCTAYLVITFKKV